MPDPKPFDIDLKFLPPELQVKLWILSLDADTSKVNLSFKTGLLKTSVEYGYGGAIEASMGVRRFTGTLGVNPSDSSVNLGLVFKGFNFKASANIPKEEFGLNIGYGAPLLPLPAELSGPFQAAGASVINMGGDIGAAINDPLQFYKMHSNDVDAITKAVSLGQSVAKVKSGPESLGAGLRLNYSAASGLVIYGGVSMAF